MLHIVTCLWQENDLSARFSRCFDESWVNKLFSSMRRNLTRPFRFVVLTDRERKFDAGIDQERLATAIPHYGCLIEPFRFNEPTMICCLDMIILRNIDHLADYCLTADTVAAPRNPYDPAVVINPIVLAPAGHRYIYDNWRGENDMEWLRRQKTVFIDDMWPNDVVSLKAHKIRDEGVGNASIVYCHGTPKPHALLHLDWVRQHWR